MGSRWQGNLSDDSLTVASSFVMLVAVFEPVDFGWMELDGAKGNERTSATRAAFTWMSCCPMGKVTRNLSNSDVLNSLCVVPC